MKQLTPMGIVKILAQVTAIMVIPMVGGAIVGLVIDTMLGTSPLCVVLGLAVGTGISAIGVWLLVRAGLRSGYGSRSPRHDA